MCIDISSQLAWRTVSHTNALINALINAFVCDTVRHASWLLMSIHI